MILQIKVNTNSKTTSITKVADDKYVIKLRANREKGEANAKLIELLAKHLHVPKSNIRILRGFKNSVKIVEVDSCY